MKKAKLILAGIACMAVVGGAFAFKASRGAGNYYAATSTTVLNNSLYRVCQPLKGYNTTNVISPTYTLYTATTRVNNITVCTLAGFTSYATFVGA